MLGEMVKTYYFGKLLKLDATQHIQFLLPLLCIEALTQDKNNIF